MSMFYELMMRKKTEIMYATIKGSLTENDGVFSGFSSSNYLITQDYIDIDNTSNIEIVVKINKPSNKDQNMFIATDTNFGFVLRTTYSGYISCYVGNGNSFNIANGVTGTHILDNNKDYYVKIKIANGSFNVMISEDNQTYITDNTFDISSLTTTKQYLVNFGIGRTTSTYFTGSIDLNNSYIKLGSTKYKLQAVVGYTVVGSPTISDGVVSGFSSSNYLTLGIIPNFTKLERFVKFTTNSVSSVQNTIGVGNYGGIGLDANGNIRTTIFTGSYVTMTLDTVLSANTTYYYKDILENGIVTGFLYDSNKNLIESKTSALGTDTGTSYFIGNVNQHGRPFAGSIDLNETYIKVDNKLWFNGQPS